MDDHGSRDENHARPFSTHPVATPALDKTGTASRDWVSGDEPTNPGGLPPGTRIGRYVVNEKIGEGGMGTVYLARDHELGRDVALKRLHDGFGGGDDAQSRLLREARSMAQLAHPNAVTVYDLLIHEGHLVLAMALVPGETLRAWLERERRPWRAVVAKFIEAGRGLAAAHAVGLVHRDFKPENVLLGNDGRVCVTDFGLARPVAEADVVDLETTTEPRTPAFALAATMTRSGVLMGTPVYMAPEQHRGRADARSDQFAFSAALHEALAGELPFAGDTWDELRRAVERGAARPLTARDAPVWLQRIVRRGLAADRAARFPSMDALLEELGRDPAVRRRRWLVAAGIVASVTATSAVGYTQARVNARRMCAGAPAQMVGVWDDAVRADVSAKFAATGKPYAADAWRGVAQTIDGYARAWTTMHTDACEATRVRGEQSEDLLDLRMACLAERREELKSVTASLKGADAQVVRGALETAQSLRSLQGCADARALRALPEPPPAQRERVRALEAELGRVRGLQNVGSYAEALVLAGRVAGDAAGLGFAPLEAEALVEIGWLQRSNGELEASEKTLYRAAYLADGAGDDRDRAWAWASLLYGVAYASKKTEGVGNLRAQALAAARRVPSDVELQATLEGVIGSLLLDEDKPEEARAAFERQLAAHEHVHGKDCVHAYVPLANIGLSYTRVHDDARARGAYVRALGVAEKELGPSSPDTALVVGQLGSAMDDAGDYAQAEANHRRAVLVVEAALGAENPGVAIHLGNLARALSNQARFAEAIPVAERALAIREKALGPAHMKLVYPLLALGEALVGAGQHARAVPLLERALALKVAASVGTARGEAKFQLARALDASGQDRARARALAGEAREELQKSSGRRDQRVLGHIDEWLLGRTLARR